MGSTNHETTTPIITPPSPRVLPPTPRGTGLGIEGLPPSPTADDPDGELLSPLQSPKYVPPRDEPTPLGLGVPSPPQANGLNGAARRANSQARPGPFNFQPMVAAKAAPGGPRPNQRRGHKYKHSSVSHQIFLEPPVRAPLSFPASLPVPTSRELLSSLSSTQKTRLSWCLVHLAVAGFTLYSAKSSLSLAALSHLTFFDGLGASICVAVDVLSNFEVWKRSSIRHPFGLERAEVLAGFAMSVFLLFMGFDILSHGAEHLIEGWYQDPHGHGGSSIHEEHLLAVPTSRVDLAALAALCSTTISAILLKNHARIGRAMRFAAIESLPSILANPSHLLTIVCSTVLLIIPLLALPLSAWLDRALAVTMAAAMVTIGTRLVRALGSMLLMSYGGDGVGKVMAAIQSDREVTEVLEARFWQAHHGLGIATLKLAVAEGEKAEERVRERVIGLVKDILGKGGKGTGGDGKEKTRWEVSVAVTLV